MLYVFHVRSGVRDKTGREYTHWECSTKFPSKVSVRRAKGGQRVRPQDIYTGEQLIRKFGTEGSRRILLECRRFCPEEFRERGEQK